ncbi:MAG: hypothetical protein ACOCZT_03375, partial [Halanaerobiales bacterium]
DITGYKENKISGETVEKFIDELHKSNIHNAYYYSLGILKYTPEDLYQLLLNLGSIYIPDTLGHSISCFFPVITDIINSEHPVKGTALFSIISYLSRFPYPEDIMEKNLEQTKPQDYDRILKISSSGDGIVNLHHMITFFILLSWENASFNHKKIVPYNIFLNWIKDKKIDRNQEEKVLKLKKVNKQIDNYTDFSKLFSPDNPEESIDTFIFLLDTIPEKAIDWIFRIYPDYYTPNWDPHYITSIYCAIRLYLSRDIDDKISAKMAVYQAIKYFLNNNI